MAPRYRKSNSCSTKTRAPAPRVGGGRDGQPFTFDLEPEAQSIKLASAFSSEKLRSGAGKQASARRRDPTGCCVKALRCVAGSLPPVNASREIPGGAERFCMEPLNIWRTCKREEGEEGGGGKGGGYGRRGEGD